ncbi:Transcription factor MYB98 [Heracleum sosnowskyi]|uniref:Transcription factor MYB98 n=1 Tax=Heracleum sosnowskyi TaxID=360622 RepID=A0AAD8IY71_9APIA|nr:Transcription factor MYB98 [Heracleum sosnowskyi]
MANHQGGGYAHVLSFGFSPHNNIPPPPPPHPLPPVVYNTNPMSTPPLSAIDKNYLEVPYDSNNFFYEENRHSGLNNNLSPRGGNNQQATYDFFMTASQIRDWEKSVGVINGDEEMARRTSSDQLGRQKKKSRVRGTGNSSNNIKGQWTVEEDRKLLSLMHRYGDKKWAQISEEMFRRSGKQCRERWQNHLRPDIKKDGWSEDEEKMLIEAHQSLGNKWAEIAKRIPGRSENTIKNHWNATKRRQFTKRKNRKDNEASRNCVLHDYIKAKILKAAANQTSENSTLTRANINSDDPFSTLGIPTFQQSISEDSTSLIEPTYDEDINNFMKSLFGNNDNNNSPNLIDDIGKLFDDGNVHSSSNAIENGTMIITADQQNKQVDGNFANENVAPVQPMDASKVSDMLDEVYSTPYLDYCYEGTPCIDKVQQQQLMNHQAEASPSSRKKEMDLIELVLANFQYSE